MQRGIGLAPVALIAANVVAQDAPRQRPARRRACPLQWVIGGAGLAEGTEGRSRAVDTRHADAAAEADAVAIA
ncbi:MAG TPA: hypothetical protein VFM52_05665 [Rhodanobacter sp.]|nr:hypothetical protein [Rhodanobacter sp.]